ncbi:hypothetical protein TNCV_4732021, partial [Trichonephila clavipes]
MSSQPVNKPPPPPGSISGKKRGGKRRTAKAAKPKLKQPYQPRYSATPAQFSTSLPSERSSRKGITPHRFGKELKPSESGSQQTSKSYSNRPKENKGHVWDSLQEDANIDFDSITSLSQATARITYSTPPPYSVSEPWFMEQRKKTDLFVDNLEESFTKTGPPTMTITLMDGADIPSKYQLYLLRSGSVEAKLTTGKYIVSLSVQSGTRWLPPPLR